MRSRAGPVRVLIVEDVADLRDFYAILLREEGYECACATDGSDALRWLSWDPDVILLDLMMPVMDGYEFYARLRDLPGDHPPVIVASAVAPRRTELPGVPATLPKPVALSSPLHRVAIPSASAAVSAPCPRSVRARRVARRTSSNPSSSLLQAAPSAPMPTITRACRRRTTSATPEPSLRFDDGQWVTALPLSRRIC